MKYPQEYLYEYTKNSKKMQAIYNSLNREDYWLVWTDREDDVWNFEYNSYSNIPDAQYRNIIKIMNKAGYRYCFQ